MKSRNIYHIPIREEQILHVIIDSPGHKVYKSGERVDDGTKAVDFLCKEGVSVGAGLEGRVVAVFNNVIKNWDREEEPPRRYIKPEEQDGNYVVIEHANGEFSIYSHMQKNSITVKKGDSVRTGQKIGLSGNTGWSLEPHVHMMVHYFPPKNKGGYRSLIPRFDTESEKIIRKKLISHKKFQTLRKK